MSTTVELGKATAEIARLRASIKALVSDWQANGGSRPLGDPTESTWYACARQLLEILDES